MTFEWQSLMPGRAYDVWVFGLTDSTTAARNRVSITGASPSISFDQNLTTGNLWVNGQVGSSSNPLESFAVPAIADSSGRIAIQVTPVSLGGGVGIAGLAVRERPMEISMTIVTTSDNPIVAGQRNQGWYLTSPAIHSHSGNYIVGRFDSTYYRDYFTFDLSSISQDVRIIDAVLQLTRFTTESSSATEVLVLHDVSSSAVALNTGGYTQSKFDDLGAGRSYGSFTVSTTGNASDVLSFILNETAIEDLNQHVGSFFSVGGTLDQPGPRSRLFGNSQTSGTQQLLLFVEHVLPGDYNGDRTVNAADYTVWRNAVQSGNLAADGNGDGMVTRLDYDVWKSHYGETLGGGSAVGASLLPVVPEPALQSLVLELSIILAAMRSRRLRTRLLP
jgi:hypothetical protein